MAGALDSSLSALTAYQRALATTSHNVANANTDGYSRQSVTLATRQPNATGAGFVGTGVNVTSVTRSFDEFIQVQYDETTAKYNSLNTFHSFASRVNNVLADPDLGVTNALSTFMVSLQDLADNPESLSQRQLVMSEADSLAERFSTLTSQLDQIDKEVEGRIVSSVEQVNALTAAVADLNQKIAVQKGAAGGRPPNDLLDQRDLAVTELNALIRVNAVEQDDGQVNLYTGNGQTLVLGSESFSMDVQKNEFDPNRHDIVVASANGSGVNISSQLSGGELGGLLDVRRDVIDPSRNTLGRIAVGLAETFNTQHRQGMDLQGQMGGDFFSITGPQILPGANNTSPATVSASIDSVGGLTESNYLLEFEAGAWQLTTERGVPVAMTGAGTAADPFVADGLSFVVSGAPNNGDEFLVRPTASAASTFSTALTDVRDIAAAAPVRTSVGLNNLSDAIVSPGTVVDATDPDLLNTVTIEFTTPTTYSVNGSGAFAYTSGSPISVNGWEMAITGVPEVGDQFVVESNSGGIADNRNALALSGVDKIGVLENGNYSVQDGTDQMVGDVATLARRAELNRDSQQGLLDQQTEQKLSVQGVNLDEEAANLLRYQQAYEAAAQVMSTANGLFQTLMRAIS